MLRRAERESTVGLVLRLLLASSAFACKQTSTTTVLLVDPRVVDLGKNAGWEQTVGPVKKDPANPILIEDQIYDVRWDNTYITSMYDEATETFRLYYNGFITCSGYTQDADKPSIHNSCAHPTWHTTFGKKGLIPWKGTPQSKPSSATMYATSTDGVNFTKYSRGLDYPWNGTAPTPIKNTSILLWGDAATGTGIIYDEHEKNASRRYKAFGTWWNYGKTSDPLSCERPRNPVHGTKWPPCHTLGCSYSSDGITFDHANNYSGNFVNAPGMDTIGQDDGSLDLAIWDDDLPGGGGYWGLVRIDASSDKDNGAGRRRTGRFVSKDWVTFSAAEQVFEGTEDYQDYTVQPFRLPEWPVGQYLATVMYFSAMEAQGWVHCELIQSLDFGENWTRLAPNQPFIPLGAAGQFDSHTLYTAWTGKQGPLLNPKDENETLFYYAGGDGPHTGQRDDSIGLARATTHAYAGLVAKSAATMELVVEPLHSLVSNKACSSSSNSSSSARYSILVDADAAAGGCIRVGLVGSKDSQMFEVETLRDYNAGTNAIAGPVWAEIPSQLFEHHGVPDAEVQLVFEAVPPATLYAIRIE